MEDQTSSSFRDIRSASIDRKRALKAKQKYFSYRSHHPSTIGQPYLAFRPDPERPRISQDISNNSIHSGIPIPQLGESTCVKIWTKRDMWEERMEGIYPLRRPHHYGRCYRCHDTQTASGKRQMAKEKVRLEIETDKGDKANLDCEEFEDRDLPRWTHQNAIQNEFENGIAAMIGSSQPLECLDESSESSEDDEAQYEGEGTLAKTLGFEMVEANLEWDDSSEDDWFAIG